MNATDKTRDLHTIAAGAFNAIREMVEALRAAREAQDNGEDDAEEKFEAAETVILQDPLSVRVRDGWRSLGEKSDGAEEFEILLSTGGPATRIIGELNEHGEPEKPVLQAQDWFTTWEAVPHGERPDDYEEVLLDYCRAFYFAEYN